MSRRWPFAALVDPLTRTVRSRELRWFERRCSADAELAETFEVVTASIRASLARREEIRARAAELRRAAEQLRGAAMRDRFRRHIAKTVPSTLRRWADERALARGLGLDAMLTREVRAMERWGARVEVGVRILRGLVLREASDLDIVDVFDRSRAHGVLRRLVQSEPRRATRRAAVACLAEATAAILRAHGERADIDPAGIRLLRRTAVSQTESPWVRRAALGVISGLDGTVARRWLEQFLGVDDGPDAYLVRARAAELALARSEGWAMELVGQRLEDPSELVRQTIASGAARRLEWDPGSRAAVAMLLQTDPEPRVRAVAAATIAEVAPSSFELLAGPLFDEDLVAYFAADGIVAALQRGVQIPIAVQRSLARLRDEGRPGVARRCALALLVAKVVGAPGWETASTLATLGPGKRRRVSLPQGVGPLDLAQALVPFAAQGYGFTLRPRLDGSVVVTRGDVLRPAMWRVLHEVRNPHPGKRQAHDHTVAPMDCGPIRVPPRGLAEESATDVPGQRVRVEAEDGWAPEVPMVQDYLDATVGQRVTIVSAEGVTTITPPESRGGRWRAKLRLLWSFGDMDRLRAAVLPERRQGAERLKYVGQMDALGFRTMHSGRGPWRSYFRVFLDPITYLMVGGANVLGHLAAVIGLLFVLLLGRMIAARSQIRRSRDSIPLVIGGWGTRGKSGTERLKAALFQAAGVPFLAKTTGCEAIVLAPDPLNDRALELFLFRPYDKATIWEQAHVMQLAAALDVRVLLWECMALRPRYVDILQRWWVKDDLATITNAYPDHEDVQGPTGMDVAEVLSGFSPDSAHVYTTEHNMFPVIEHVAGEHGSDVTLVPRSAQELIPEDLMSRLPYREHRSNVALMVALADRFGIPATDAIGLVAEYVVPDLGALAVYPRATVAGRQLEFANGMSANDELSFRYNWSRVGYREHDAETDPGTWLITVVNNRADRIPRSRVFAEILANEGGAHRHVLIGTNVAALRTWILAAFSARCERVDINDDHMLGQVLQHLKIVDAAALADHCGGSLEASDEALGTWRRSTVRALAQAPGRDWAGVTALAETVRGDADLVEASCGKAADGLADALVDALRRQLGASAARAADRGGRLGMLRELMDAAILLVDDPKTRGAVIVEQVARAAPPGVLVRVMGVQNIKGTGLDFVYQWVEWRDIRRELDALQSGDAKRRAAAIEALMALPLRSEMACDAVSSALLVAAEEPAVRRRALVAIEEVRSKREALGHGASKPRSWPVRVALSTVERVIDPFDAILRRRRADRVYADLGAGRISHRDAADLLRGLTKRQKGRWLA